MKLLYKGKTVTEIITNHSMTIDEAICKVLELDNLNDDNDAKLEKLVNKPYIYISGYDGTYQVDIDGFEMEY